MKIGGIITLFYYSFIISVCYNGGLRSLSVSFSTFQWISVGFNGFRWFSIGFGEFQ